MRVLIVEDEAPLREALVDLATGAGHDVLAVGDGEAAVEAGTREEFDLVLLDLMLPKMSGYEVCENLRAHSPGLFIIMLTARGSEDDKVRGLQIGADDYVTKPFGARELLARIDAFARRMERHGGDAERATFDGCDIDFGRCVAKRNGETVSLTAREVAILRLLHRHRERAVSRAEMLEEVWGMPGDLVTRTVDMTIANLRQKVEREPKSPRIVVTVKGVGYAWGKET